MAMAAWWAKTANRSHASGCMTRGLNIASHAEPFVLEDEG